MQLNMKTAEIKTSLKVLKFVRHVHLDLQWNRFYLGAELEEKCWKYLNFFL